MRRLRLRLFFIAAAAGFLLILRLRRGHEGHGLSTPLPSSHRLRPWMQPPLPAIRQRFPSSCNAKHRRTEEGSAGSENPDGRIVGSSRMPLKQRIKHARSLKQIRDVTGGNNKQQNSPQTPLKRTAFTKQKKPESEDPGVAAIVDDTKKGESASLRQLYTEDKEKSMLLIDAYNVMHLWPDLKTLLTNGGGEEARGLFLERIGEYATWRGIKAQVIFDGISSSTDHRWKNVEIIYGRDQEADNVISEEILKLHMEDVHPVFVASSDNAVQISTVSFGAFVVPSIMLVQEVEVAYEELQQLMHEYDVYQAYLDKLPGDRAMWIQDMTLSFQRKNKLASASDEERLKMLREEEEEHAQRLKNQDFQGKLGSALGKDIREKLQNLKDKLKANPPSRPTPSKPRVEKRKKQKTQENGKYNFEEESLESRTTDEPKRTPPKMARVKESLCISGCGVTLLNGVYEEDAMPLLGRPHYVKKGVRNIPSGALHLYYTQTDGVGRWVISEEIGSAFRAVVDSDQLSPLHLADNNQWLVFNHTWLPAELAIVSTASRAEPAPAPAREIESNLNPRPKSIEFEVSFSDAPGAGRRNTQGSMSGSWIQTRRNSEHKSTSRTQRNPSSRTQRNLSSHIHEGSSSRTPGNPNKRDLYSRERKTTRKSTSPSVKLANGETIILPDASRYLNEYCLKEWSKPPKYRFEAKRSKSADSDREMYVATVELPSVKENPLVATGVIHSSKRMARASAALNALRILSKRDLEASL